MVNAGHEAFPGIINQIIKYVQGEAEGNETYLDYEKNADKWNGWVRGISNRTTIWTIPEDFEEAKTLAYTLFKKVAAEQDQGFGLTSSLYHNSSFADNVADFKRDFGGYFAKALQDIANDPKNIELIEPLEETPNGQEPKTVFIIHGHDEGFKTAVQLLIEKAKLNPVVLHEIPDIGRTLIEKLVEEGERPSFAIALLSPDDVVTVVDGGDGENGVVQKQPRPNVFLEIGYFLGKLGRPRVLLIKKGDLKIPSDLTGILYKEYDAAGKWKIEVLKEIEAARLPFDLGETIKKI